MSLKSFTYRLWHAALPVLPGSTTGQSQRCVAIVMVHDVHEASGRHRLPPPETSVSLECFESNVLGLAKTFSFVSMDEAVDMLAGRIPWRAQSVALTFDDSLKCLSELAVPRLARWGIPATFYLSTDAIDRQQPYWWHRLDYALAHLHGMSISLEMIEGPPLVIESPAQASSLAKLRAILRQSTAGECERIITFIESSVGVSLSTRLNDYPYAALMTWDDVRSMARRGMTIGCHSRTHPNLNSLEGNPLAEELLGAKKIMEARAVTSCRHFCYPYGAFSQRICDAVRNAGFASAVTTIRPGWNGSDADLFRLHRFHMHGEPYCLPCIMSGLGRLLSKWRKPDTCANAE